MKLEHLLQIISPECDYVIKGWHNSSFNDIKSWAMTEKENSRIKAHRNDIVKGISVDDESTLVIYINIGENYR